MTIICFKYKVNNIYLVKGDYALIKPLHQILYEIISKKLKGIQN